MDPGKKRKVEVLDFLGRQIYKVKVVAWLVTPVTLETLAFHSWKLRTVSKPFKGGRILRNEFPQGKEGHDSERLSKSVQESYSFKKTEVGKITS